jgi:hypothetical protein
MIERTERELPAQREQRHERHECVTEATES